MCCSLKYLYLSLKEFIFLNNNNYFITEEASENIVEAIYGNCELEIVSLGCNKLKNF